MAKKAAGTKKPSTEILDDNGTLISTPDTPGAKARVGGGGEASAKPDKRDIPGPS
jgi:hypothetical protein